MKDFTNYLLEPDKYYHLFNRANGNELLFVSEGNYHFFLSRYRHYITPLAETLAYCLMPNHVHFAIRIKSNPELLVAMKDIYGSHFDRKLDAYGSIEKMLSRQFANLFSSYSQAYNKQQSRKGNLFMHRFKRKPIEDQRYLIKLIHYIHWNPVVAQLAKNPSGWQFSSYNAIVSEKPTTIVKPEIIELFDSMENFIYCHRVEPLLSGIE